MIKNVSCFFGSQLVKRKTLLIVARDAERNVFFRVDWGTEVSSFCFSIKNKEGRVYIIIYDHKYIVTIIT